MRKKLGSFIRNKDGFSLVEMLVVVVIVLLVSVIVATGVPVAVRAYSKVMDTANAQVLLSTTITRLKDELGKASEIKTQDEDGDGVYDYTKIEYLNSMGSNSLIYKKEATEDNKLNDIYLWDYYGYEGSNEDNYSHKLVSDSASNKNLHVSYTDIKYVNGIVTVTNLTVKKNGGTNDLAKADKVEIRVIADGT